MKKPLLLCASLFGLVLDQSRGDQLEATLQIVASGANAPAGFASDNNAARGAAFNPTNGNILFITGGVPTNNPTIHVLSQLNGAVLHTMSQTGVTSGGSGVYKLNMIVADSAGVIYAADLDSKAGTSTVPRQFRIFRWENDDPATEATVAFDGDPAGVNESTNTTNNPQRWGDSLDIIGSGTNTIIAAASSASSNIALFTTTDGLTYTPHVVPNVAQSAGSISIAIADRISNFDDPATPAVESLDVVSIFTKRSSSQLRQAFVRLDTFTVVGSPKNYSTPPTSGIAIGAHPASKKLGMITLNSAADNGRVYTWSADYSQVTESANTLFPVNEPNANLVGSVDFYQPPGQQPLRVLFLDSSNILAVYDIVPEVVAPTLASPPPATLTIIDTGYATLTVGAAGTPPFTYQWLKDDQPIAGATSFTLNLTNVSAAATAGTYKVTVTNSAGSTTSTGTVVSVTPRVNTNVLTEIWRRGGGASPLLQNDNLHRSLAYNADANHLLVLSRTSAQGYPSPAIALFDPNTGDAIMDGATPRSLMIDPVLISKGTFPLNTVGVSGDGAVYAANLTDIAALSRTPIAANYAFRIYRWANDASDTAPSLAYAAPGSSIGDNLFGNERVGDSLAVRGSGLDTQILVPARNEAKLAVFTTLDGETFQPTIFIPTGATIPAGSFFHACFGAGNTIWAKGTGTPLHLISFDIATGQASVVRTIPAAQVTGTAPIGFDPVNGLLGAVAFADTPDNFRLYKIQPDPTAPELLDQEFFATDNPNLNGTGAVAFAGNKVWALDSNNGIGAWTITLPTPATPPSLSQPTLTNGGTEFGFTLTGTVGVTYRIEGSDTLATGSWTTVQTVTLTSATQAFTFPVTGGQLMRYWRVVTP